MSKEPTKSISSFFKISSIFVHFEVFPKIVVHLINAIIRVVGIVSINGQSKLQLNLHNCLKVLFIFSFFAEQYSDKDSTKLK